MSRNTSPSTAAMFRRHADEVEVLTANQQRRLLAAVRQGLSARDQLALGITDSALRHRLATEVRIADRAKDRLVCANMRLVVWVVGRFARRSRWLDRDDLIQEGVSGLTRAIEKFDPALGTTLSTYASWWIRQSVTRATMNAGLVRIPVHVGDGTSRNNPRIVGWARRFDKIDSIEELHESLEATEAEMAFAGDLDDWPDAGLDPDRGLAISDDFVGDFETSALVGEALAHLSSRDAYILASRHGLHGEPKTLEEIGRSLGITRERVRQIEQTALASARLRLTPAA